MIWKILAIASFLPVWALWIAWAWYNSPDALICIIPIMLLVSYGIWRMD